MPLPARDNRSATDPPATAHSHLPARRVWVDWVTWSLLRIALIGIIAGTIPWPEQVNDLNIYADWAAESLRFGRFPTDEMWQYPPLAGPVMLAGAALPGERLGFVTLFLAFDALIMVMLTIQARRTGLAGGMRLWALLPLLVGPLVLARFDVVPTALAVAAVLMTARPGLSGALAGIGAWLKVWPVLVLLALTRRALLRGIAGALAASVAIVLILLAATTDPLSFMSGQRNRGLQIESLPAWPFLVSRALGAPVEVVYRFGAHEVQASGVEIMASVAPAITLVLLAVVAIQRLRGALEGMSGADVALAAVLFTVATSRVFSGQYFIWLLGLAAVSLGDPRSRMRRTTTLLVAAAAATHVVYPWLYSALLDGHPAAVLAQSLRVVLTIAATVTALQLIMRPRGRADARGSTGPASGTPGP